jgi:hypothetical protein
MNKLLRINSERFSVRLCRIAENYGFKTVGSLYKAVKQAKPTTKWSNGVGYLRGSRIIKELEDFTKEESAKEEIEMLVTEAFAREEAEAKMNEEYDSFICGLSQGEYEAI